jgi:inhibitor of KinA sporulation pathway (predicted exonuclease)
VLELATLEPGERESVLVVPTGSTISAFCTELTTLTPEQVAGGVTFSEACAALAARHHTRERGWASWGDFDRRIFEQQCAREAVPSPFGISHLNVKHLFAAVHGQPQETGMMEALRVAKMPHQGTHHRGGDDAWNIAGLLAGLLRGARQAR